MTYPAIPISRVADVVLGKMLKSVGDPGDQYLPYLRAAHVQPHGQLLDLGDDQRMYFTAKEVKELTLRAGDMVIVEGGAGYGRSAVLDHDLEGWAFQNSIIRVRPRPGQADARFLSYGLQAAMGRGEIDLVVNTATIPHFTAEKISRFSIPMAPAEEQRRIADYLDRETATIDALIEKQRRLIAGLRERRQTAISVGVTAGFGSGVSVVTDDGYFPSIAGGWTLQPIGFGFDVVLGKMLDAGRKPVEGDVDLPYVRAANIKDGYLDLADVNSMPYTPHEARRLDLRAGDLLVVEGGSVGQSALLHQDMSGWSFQKTVNRVRSKGEWSAAFLGYVLTHMRARGHIDMICAGSTIAHLTAEKLRAIRIPVPPLDEQRAIADRLDRETAKIDALIAKAERFIELAQERRAALITAAVTGQLEIPAEESAA